MKSMQEVPIKRFFYQLLVVGITFSAIGVVFIGSRGHSIVVAQARSATYHKGGRLWYRGSGKHGVNVEIMKKRIKANIHGSYKIPKNKTKHFRLYTVKGIPVVPSKKKGYVAPAYVSEWDQITTGAWPNETEFNHFPKIIKKGWGKRYMAAYSRGNTLIQYDGNPIKSFKLPAVHATILKYQTGDGLGGNTVDVPSSEANVDITKNMVHEVTTTKSFKYMDKRSFLYTWGVYYGLQKMSRGDHFPAVNVFARTHPKSFSSLWPKNYQWVPVSGLLVHTLGDLSYTVDAKKQTVTFSGYPIQPGHYVFKFYVMATDSVGNLEPGRAPIKKIGSQTVDIVRGKTITVSEEQFDRLP